jgi:DNA polymerase epsilon subunit 2
LVQSQRATIANANAKIELFLQRYRIIYQRTLRHELFSPCSISESAHSTNGKKKFQLKPIEFLLSNTDHEEETIVLGMIAQLKENKFYLEDPTGHLPLNLAEAVIYLIFEKNFSQSYFATVFGNLWR